MAICKSCRAEIRWVRFATSGQVAPIDKIDNPLKGNIVIIGTEPDGTPRVRLVEPIETTSGAKLYTSHFATCPSAKEHRKPRVSK